MRHATMVTSDRHYGDKAQYLRTMREATGRAIEIIRAFQPDEITVLENGDTVAGRGIFKEQGLQNAVQLGSDQVWLACYDFLGWHKTLSSIAPTNWKLLQGNHDEVARESLVPQLVQVMRSLNIPARFEGRVYIGNFAPADAPEYLYEAQHGFAGGSYYANGTPEIVAAMRSYIEYSQTHNVQIKRFLRGHVHWLNVGQTVAYGCLLDTTGGWHRNERIKLPSTLRDTGCLVYLHDGENLTIQEVRADAGLLQAENYSRTHNYTIMAETARALQVMAEWAAKEGLA